MYRRFSAKQRAVMLGLVKSKYNFHFYAQVTKSLNTFMSLCIKKKNIKLCGKPSPP